MPHYKLIDKRTREPVAVIECENDTAADKAGGPYNSAVHLKSALEILDEPRPLKPRRSRKKKA